MDSYGFTTKTGGDFKTGIIYDKFKGKQVLIHIDQTANIKNSGDECDITLDIDEVKGVIEILNNLVLGVEGKPYVAIIDYTNSQSDEK